MADRTGNAYEQLTSRLMLELESASAVATIEIAQRKFVQGRTTSHEIDVWWVFDWQGRRFSVAFQCKDWARTVDQGELLKFQAVLADIAAHDPAGVFVTRTGYQSGSRRVAAGNRISIIELRELSEVDWAGRVRKVDVAVSVAVPGWRHFEIQVRPDVDPGAVVVQGSNDALIVHQPGQPAQSILSIQKRLSPSSFEAMGWRRTTMSFQLGAWLTSTEDPDLHIPVSGFSAEFRQDVHESHFVVEGSSFVTHVLENVLTGAVVSFGPDARPLESGAGIAVLDLKAHNRGESPAG